MSRWTSRQINILKNKYPKIDMNELIRELDKSSQAIRYKAFKLKLKRLPKKIKKFYCINCNKNISRVSTRCIICSNKYRKGFKHTEAIKKHQSIIKLGNKNPMWKGDKVGYSKLHEWIRRHKPKSNFCEICGEEKKLEAANLSGKYKRDLSDYAWYCIKCHRRRDAEVRKIKGIKLKRKKKC